LNTSGQLLLTLLRMESSGKASHFSRNSSLANPEMAIFAEAIKLSFNPLSTRMTAH
jgi:hypothetical protein